MKNIKSSILENIQQKYLFLILTMNVIKMNTVVEMEIQREELQ